MAEQSDRVVIKLGPGRLDSDKAVQREIDQLRDEVETKTSVPPGEYTTPGDVEDIVNDIINEYPPVAGGGGFVIGIPPGVPLAYAPLNLVNFPIDVTAVKPEMPFRTVATTGGIATVEPRLSRDISNVLGMGVDTILSYDRTASAMVAFSPSSGLVETVDFPLGTQGRVTGFFSIGDTDGSYLVSYSDFNDTATPIIYTYDGTNVSSFSPTFAGSNLVAIGPSAGYTRIILVWANESTQTLHIQQYKGDGSDPQFFTHTGLSGIQTGAGQSSLGKVENGYIAIPYSSAGEGYYMRPASIDNVTLKPFSVPNAMRNNITSAIALRANGRLYSPSTPDLVTGQTDLVICSYDTNITQTFPGAIYNPFDSGPRPWLYPVNVGVTGGTTISPRTASMAVIDDNKIVVTGSTVVYDGVSYYGVPVSLYITIIPDPDNPLVNIFTNAYLTHEDYPYPTTIVGSQGLEVDYDEAVAKCALALSDGSVVYVIGNAQTSTGPGYCIMFNVKPVDYVP